MPNTLVHLGIQGVGNRLLSKRIDLKWVFLGCVIPDIPWILRRALVTLFPGTDQYEVTLYAGVQASLAFCVLLSLFFAVLSTRPRLVFGLLSVNALIHLLLDATEVKWGNGVFLFAPLTWELTNFGWLWPDSVLVAILSLIGLIVGVWAVAHPAPYTIDTRFRPSRRILAAFCLLALYVLSPLVLTHGPRSVDHLSIATLENTEQRIGKEVRMDRRAYKQLAEGDVVITLAGEPLRVVGETRASSPQVSFIGEFVDYDAVVIDQLHEFHSPWRDLASYVGLSLIALLWLSAFYRQRLARR